jgi:hypothetical protein
MQAGIQCGAQMGRRRSSERLMDRTHPMLILPHGPGSDERRQEEIRRLETQNQRVFSAFVLGCALLCALLVLALLLRWRL